MKIKEVERLISACEVDFEELEKVILWYQKNQR